LKKKQGDFNFALGSREGNFSCKKARIVPTSPGLVNSAVNKGLFEIMSYIL